MGGALRPALRDVCGDRGRKRTHRCLGDRRYQVSFAYLESASHIKGQGYPTVGCPPTIKLKAVRTVGDTPTIKVKAVGTPHTKVKAAQTVGNTTTIKI